MLYLKIALSFLPHMFNSSVYKGDGIISSIFEAIHLKIITLIIPANQDICFP